MACGAAEAGTGVAMFMLHIFDDKLWALGPKKALAPIFQHAVAKKEEAAPQKAGKEEVKVDETKAEKKQEKGKEKEKEKKKESESEEEEEEESEEEEQGGGDDFDQFFGSMIKKKAAPQPSTAAPKKTIPAAKTTVTKPVAAKKQDDFDDDDDVKGKKGGKQAAKGKGKGKGKKEEEDEPPKKGQKGKKGKKAQESESEDEDEEEEEEQEEEKKVDTGKGGAKGGAAIPTKIMEEYLMEAFLTALKVSLDEKDLPIDGQEFFSKHMNPCRREGVNLDLKNTSYQKMGKFLQAMSKTSIIEFKESKKGANPQITKINRHHPKLADFEPVVAKSSKKDKEEEEEETEEERWPKVQIQEVCKVKPQIAVFFPEDA